MPNCLLVGGFNPVEKYSSNWMISLGRGENNKYLKPPPSLGNLLGMKYITQLYGDGMFFINDEIYNFFIKQPGFNSWKVSGTPVFFRGSSVMIPTVTS